LLLRTHVPDQYSLLPYAPRWRALVATVFAGCNESLLNTGLSRRLLSKLSLDAWTPTPVSSAAFISHLYYSLQVSSAFPCVRKGRLFQSAHKLPYSDFGTAPISGLQSFLYVQASRFARHTDRSYRCMLMHTRQLWLLRPSRTRLVTKQPVHRIYASRPKWEN
jgi:hypothetical protein